MPNDDYFKFCQPLLQFVDRNVKVIGYGKEAERDIELKLDLISRLIEIIRIEMRHIDNKFPIEEFVQGKIDLSEGITFIAPEKSKAMGSGTAPIRLQPKLLLFLLYRIHNGYDTVYNIIDDFIRVVWDHLEVLDFKKTLTGVLRCFTNTRFAAHTLRDYGLLRDTRKEAYKTWVLSLPGIIVASRMMEINTWEIPALKKDYHFELHPDIRDAFLDIDTYDKFVDRLATVCKPGFDVFKEYEQGSKKSHTSLAEYWEIIRDSSISKSDRKKQSTAKLMQIENDPMIKEFYNKFSSCVRIGDALNLKIDRR